MPKRRQRSSGPKRELLMIAFVYLSAVASAAFAWGYFRGWFS